ncbi:hypothetical protein BBP40_012793 [Aspergillus hancockii]|nr:hypothetical protein BBP40_012793 [Aspergillus hancockii]
MQGRLTLFEELNEQFTEDISQDDASGPPHISPIRPSVALNSMLHAARLVAQHMPRLQIMEIWSARRGFAGIFRYKLAENGVAITCDSTWGLQLEDRIIQIREEVVREHSTQPTLDMEICLLPADDIQSMAMLSSYSCSRGRFFTQSL